LKQPDSLCAAVAAFMATPAAGDDLMKLTIGQRGNNAIPISVTKRYFRARYSAEMITSGSGDFAPVIPAGSISDLRL
jgi:hypothetical protein